jgi:tripartite-type tricarboxylate transporter receptor subunit TctC
MAGIPKRSFLKGAVGFGALLASRSSPAFAEEPWPSRPIKIIVPWPPGGVADVAARIVADGIQNVLGQPTIIDNRPGASGRIGAAIAARSAPDGYTLLWGTPSSLTLPMVVDKQPPFDPLRDFKPVIQLFSSTYFLTVNAEMPVRSTSELIAYARANPGKLNYGSWGSGSAPHLISVMLATGAQIDVVQVPYKGEGALVLDMISGRVDFGFVIDVRQYVEAGKLRALGTTSSESWFTLPEVPPIGQSALPGFKFLGWMGLLAPAGTPDAAIAKLNSATNHVMGTERMKQFMNQTGHEPIGGEAQTLTHTIDEDLRTIRKIVADAHLTFDQ